MSRDNVVSGVKEPLTKETREHRARAFLLDFTRTATIGSIVSHLHGVECEANFRFVECAVLTTRSLSRLLTLLGM